MIDSLKNRVRCANAIVTGLMIAGAAALPLTAMANDEQAAATEPSAPAAVADATANQIVVKDAATGALRAATPDEANALTQSKGQVVELRRSARAVPMSKGHWSGARGARLTDEFASYAVLVRQPDGSMVAACFESREEADAALKAVSPVVKVNTAPTE